MRGGHNLKEITKADISLPKRNRMSHKGDFGRVLLICGSKKYTGAAYFAAQAAVNTGSGLVFLAIPEKTRPILAAKLNEPILVPRRTSGAGFDATLFGCGVGLSRESLSILKRELKTAASPLVLDADAITLMARHGISPKDTRRELILTPHEGEFRRLVPDFSNDRREAFASAFAKKEGCILVLKGHRTVIAAPDGEIFINTTGNPGMAKGGSGDVLAGIITSLIGQGIPPKEAAYIGVWLHGAAGDRSAEAFGEYSMTPTDMLGCLKSTICEVQKSD